MEDFDNHLDKDFELLPEDIADIKQALQDINMGFSYEMLFDGNFANGDMKCNKCNRVGNFKEEPFPHRFDCPMRDRVKD